MQFQLISLYTLFRFPNTLYKFRGDHAASPLEAWSLGINKELNLYSIGSELVRTFVPTLYGDLYAF